MCAHTAMQIIFLSYNWKTAKTINIEKCAIHEGFSHFYPTDYNCMKSKQEHHGVNNIFSHFLCFNFFRMIRIIQSHNKQEHQGVNNIFSHFLYFFFV